MHAVDYVALFIGLFTVSCGLLFTLQCVREKEKRAARRSLILVIAFGAVFSAGILVSARTDIRISEILILILSVTTILLLIPFRKKRGDAPRECPVVRFDERDIVYVRRKLLPGTGKFEEYYLRHPEKHANDNISRSLPGLLSPDASFYHRMLFTSVRGSLNSIYALLKERDGVPVGEPVSVDPDDMSRFIKGWCLHFGAHSAGITLLQDYHLYGTGGYKDSYGKAVVREHRYAIALTVEMDHEATGCAPYAPMWMEAARQYETSANIAIQLAVLIRHLGYPARAHVFDNYEVIAPIVARDAGLGEIGRSTLLLTPRLGPRVRIAVVTTDLPLQVDLRNWNPSILDACMNCTKCARICPSKALSTDKPVDNNGGLRWMMNALSSPQRCSWRGYRPDHPAAAADSAAPPQPRT